MSHIGGYSETIALITKGKTVLLIIRFMIKGSKMFCWVGVRGQGI